MTAVLLAACGPRVPAVPDWTADFRTADEEPFELADRDRPVLLVFWSSWAPPCTLLLREIEPLTGRAEVVTVLVGARDPAAESRAAGGLTVVVPAADTVLDRYELEVLPTVLLVEHRDRAGRRFEGYGPGLVEEIERALMED